jgi:hypothetical protein
LIRRKEISQSGKFDRQTNSREHYIFFHTSYDIVDRNKETKRVIATYNEMLVLRCENGIIS